MFAIVSIAGQQFKVQSGQFVYVHRLQDAEGASVSFDEVLLVSDGSTIQVGKPTVAGAAVKATILQHLKDDKVLVFKKKRRKGYRKLNGHRQHLTKIKIESITA